ncbi:MAG: hypothetical protein E7621_06890 [Ruminococcaceae bacterium]|nr:hypothetical protein [Oscillospiraceae bacterium]
MVNKFKTLGKVFITVFMAVTLFSCASDNIAGYYTVEKINNVYYFSEDGRIFENYSDESTSFYEIEGNKIKLYNGESEEGIMEFPFKKTKKGFLMGKLEYVRISDPFESEEQNEKS